MEERRSVTLYREFLGSLGASEDTLAALSETPKLATELLSRFFETRPEPDLHLIPFPDQGHVAVRHLSFYSLCEHHLVPFFGTMDVVYQPDGWVAGFGGIQRVVSYFSTRPQIQERMTEQVASYLDQRLKPRGLLVLSTARQMCMEMNGAAPGVKTAAMSLRGEAKEADYRFLVSPVMDHEKFT